MRHKRRTVACAEISHRKKEKRKENSTVYAEAYDGGHKAPWDLVASEFTVPQK